MSKKRYLVIFLCLFGNTLFAQYSRLGVDVVAGVPTSLTFFTPTVAMYGGVGLRYSLLKEISLNVQFNMGTMTGKNGSVNTIYDTSDRVHRDAPANYVNFTNNFYQYTVGGQINLERVFGLRRIAIFSRLNPYLSVGGGIIHSDVSAVRIPDYNGNSHTRKYSENFYTAYVGLQFRYYINPSLDFVIGSDFNMAQTQYADAVALDRKDDNYMLNHVGVSYKVGARKDRQHVEWNNVILRDRIYVPNIEKRQGQPLDAAGNYFVFHKDSIAKLQLDNLKLQEENRKQQEQIARQQQEITKLQGDVTVMKTQIDTMKTRFDTLQNQVNQIREQQAQAPERIVYVQAPPAGKGGKGKGKGSNQKPASGNDQQGTQPTDPPVTTEPAPAREQPRKQNTGRKPVATESGTEDPAVNNQPPVTKDPNVSGKTELETAGTSELNQIDGVVAPVATYNVIVGAYAGTKYAYIFRDKLRAKGYKAAVFRSDVNSKILRICAFTTEDRAEALRMMRKIRSEMDPKAWIHVYHPKQ